MHLQNIQLSVRVWLNWFCMRKVDVEKVVAEVVVIAAIEERKKVVIKNENEPQQTGGKGTMELYSHWLAYLNRDWIR